MLNWKFVRSVTTAVKRHVDFLETRTGTNGGKVSIPVTDRTNIHIFSLIGAHNVYIHVEMNTHTFFHKTYPHKRIYLTI